MARPPFIELGRGRGLARIRILYEDRSVIAVDKPAGWMLVPFSWQRTSRNLQAAITSSIAGGDFWARSRNLRFLRHVHRLDAETTGVLLLAKSHGGVKTYGDLFESRAMAKTYLAVVEGLPPRAEWTCTAKLGPDPKRIGRVRIDPRHGKDAETRFRLLQTAGGRSLLEARPITGRTHQIRVHLLAAGYPVLGDPLYGAPRSPISNPQSPILNPQSSISNLRLPPDFPLGLRAVGLAYLDPFLSRRVEIRAPSGAFVEAFGFSPPET